MQMVNAGFPERMRYGFERVDGRDASMFLRQTAVNQIFTANPMIRVFLKFSPI
jgi:hypothetical protein